MISGKVWKFGDNINTDLMLPGPLLFATEEEQKRARSRPPGPAGSTRSERATS